MSGTTSVPPPVWGPNGLVLPTEAEILAGVQADINAAFGGNVNPALETPQGQLASSEAAILADQNDQFLLLTQNVDPSYAQGRWQDAIGRIYFMTRNPALPTVVAATCTGLPGVLIPAGSMAQALDGNRYSSLADATIGPAGTVSVQFQCNVTGPISVPAGALSTIYRMVPGWDAITNPAAGVIGSYVETRAAFELRRQLSVASNSIGLLSSVQGAVLAVPGVLDAYTYENSTGTAVVLNGVTLPAHSLYCCVAGGDPQAVAQAIWNKKSIGCAMAGNTTETVLDDNSGYSPPYPSYTITFQTAIAMQFAMIVTMVNSVLVPSNATALVQQAVLTAWAGEDGGTRARIGSTIFASRYYAGIAALGPWVNLVNIKIGSPGPAATLDDLAVGIAHIPVIAAANISLVLV